MNTNNITIEIVGARLYVAGNAFPIRSAIKNAGGHWDGDRKQWWIGKGKHEEIEAVIGKQSGAASPAEKENANPTAELQGKARYKGRSYYVLWMGDTKKGPMAKLTVLDGSIVFWAALGNAPDCAVIEKRYDSGRATTLNSIRKFLDEKKNNPQTAQSRGRGSDRGTRTGCSCGSREYAGGGISDNACAQCRFDEYDN